MAAAPPPGATAPARRREVFSSRNLFILAAIGSAVGLGNIWRFPYIAYDNGGGAFIIPYLVALLATGVPLLFFDYVVGHRYRGSAPLSFARIQKWMESIGWWQVLVCVIIGIYYAVIVGWALMYTIFSVTKAWEQNADGASGFLFGDFLALSDDVGVSFDFVPGVLWPHLIIWLVVAVIIVAGVRRGIARANLVFLPLLLVMFLALVVQSLFLPGATDGLNALFTPDWSALGRLEVWAAAVGQIFFSLSIGFGIMITYASYLKRRSDLTGSGMVVAFSNSGFEILAGIGVFAALGFMAQAAGSGIEDVAGAGIGLAFVAFPTLISEAPLGAVIGVLFFGSLFFAGLTSLISIIEVIVAAVRDKLHLTRVQASLAVVIPMALVSTLLFPTTTGLYVLDVLDEFVNKFGILAAALVSVIAVAWIGRRLGILSNHLTRASSIPASGAWKVFIAGVVPVVLTAILISEIVRHLQTPYEDYPQWFLNAFGWGMAIGLVVVGALLALIPWPKAVRTRIAEDEISAEMQAVYDRSHHGDEERDIAESSATDRAEGVDR
ncbi:MAG: sodium-dependent transporter [Microbacteriaceae bacterium]|nr:sodium-dependent transporter [Microbacteriaceae bacterium]